MAVVHKFNPRTRRPVCPAKGVPHRWVYAKTDAEVTCKGCLKLMPASERHTALVVYRMGCSTFINLCDYQTGKVLITVRSFISSAVRDQAARTVPELEPNCGSWVCTSPAGLRVFEVFERSSAQLALDHGWKVETAGQYLGRLNREIKNRGGK